MSDVLKELLANPGSYGGSRDASQIKYLVFHNTGNDGDKTADNAACFRNHVVEASAHYFGCRSLAACPRSEGGKKRANAGKTGGGTMHGIVTNSRCAIPSATVPARPARQPWQMPPPWAGS